MAETIYTHNFEIEIGDEIEIEGEMEFNIDGEASWLPDAAVPLTVSQQQSLTRFLEELKRMFIVFGSIKKIKVEEK